MERETQTYFFPDDGRIPNHPDFPLVVYQNALKDTGLAEDRHPAWLVKQLVRECFTIPSLSQQYA